MAIFYSTYAKFVLTCIAAAKEIFIKHSGIKSPSDIVTNEQIKLTYLNPNLRFLKKTIADPGVPLFQEKIYTEKLRKDLSLQLEIVKEALTQVKEPSNEKKLITQQVRLEDLIQSLNQIAGSQLKRIEGKINNLISKHEQQMEDYGREFNQKLIQILNKNNLLSPQEKIELSGNLETIPEILKKYENSQLELPFDIKVFPEKPSNYLRSEAWHAIHAKLSQQIELGTITPDMVKKQMKTIDSIFDEASIFNEADAQVAKIFSTQAQARQEIHQEVDRVKNLNEKINTQLQTQRRITDEILEELKVSIPPEKLVALNEQVEEERERTDEQQMMGKSPAPVSRH